MAQDILKTIGEGVSNAAQDAGGVKLCFDLALLLLCGLLVGRAARFFRVPMVTGYILAGILIGPMGFELVSLDDIEGLGAISEVALVAIMFMIGTEFEASHFRRVGRRILTMAGFEAGVTFLLVGSLTWIAASTAMGDSLAKWEQMRLGLLLGVLAIATAPAATLMVIKEYDSEGPVTENILALVALNNLICVVLFYILMILPASGSALKTSTALFQLFQNVPGSVAAGVTIGLVVSYLDKKISGKEQVVVTIGGILLVLGLSELLELSSMLTALVFGVIFVNAASDPKTVTDEVYKTALPLYVAFFVLAGAELDLRLLAHIGLVGILYVLGRSAAKLLGISWGCRIVALPQLVRQNLGLGMLCQAGVVIGLVGVLIDHNDPLGKISQTTILAAVLIFEVVGPIMVKISVVKAGEVKLVNLLRRQKYDSGMTDVAEVASNLMRALGYNPKEKDASTLMVKHVMRQSVKPIPDHANLDEILSFVEHSKYNHFPVVDDQQRIKGLISFEDIRDILFDKGLAKLVIASDIAHGDVPSLMPDDSLERALDTFNECGYGSLPVVDPKDPEKLVGLLEQRSVLRLFHEREQQD